MKRLGYVLFAIGTVLIVLFGFADAFGISKDPGIGAAQMLGIQTGVILNLLGVGLWEASRQGAKIDLYPRRLVSRILDLPPIVWVVITFLIINYFFFFQPMFLNEKLQIDYFNRYIPNTSTIGFDIRTIMDSVEDWLVSNQSPYANGLLAYPPLALVLFSPLLLVGFPGYFNILAHLTFLSYLLTSLVLPLAQNRGRQQAIILIVFALGLLSYGLQFELERGQFNLIAFAFCYAAIYIFHTHPRYRLFAYILFSISIQLKLFTAIYVLLFIDDWSDWKGIARRLAGLGALNVALLFVLGIPTFKDFLDALTINQLDFTPWNGSSIQSFVFRLSRNGYGIFSDDVIALARNRPELLKRLLLILYAICLVIQSAYAIHQRERGFDPFLLVTCTVGALVIPAISNDYKLPLVIGPMAILLSSWSIQGKKTQRLLSIFLISISSAAFWTTLYPFEVKPDVLHINLPTLYIILISITAYRLIAGSDLLTRA